MRRSRGMGTGGPDHPSRLEKHRAVDFLRNTGLEPLEKHRPLARGHLNGISLVGPWWPVLVTGGTLILIPF